MPKLSDLTGSKTSQDHAVEHYDAAPYNESGVDTPFDLDIPSYLMCKPYTISTKSPNNAWMKDADQQEPIDYDLALRQWQALYNHIAGQADVWQLPASGNFQDQVYVANLAMVIPHMDNMVCLANMKSPPRKGEEWVGEAMFKLMKFDIKRPPYTWEGEAETKWLHDDVYIGGFGQRTDIRTYDWWEKEFGGKVIRVKMTDERLYHIDCSVFPINDEKTMVCTSVYTPQEVKAMERETEIIDVPKKIAYAGACNCVRLGTQLLNMSDFSTLSPKDKDYSDHKQHVDFMTTVCAENGLSLCLFDLGELEKSGAALSCCVMHLNEKSHGHEGLL
jgi:N-dimethylarginine dimethylaminohydrolase